MKLGDQVRDKVTGVKGVAVGKSEWLTGCNTYAIQPPVKEDGTVPDPYWVDEARIEVIEEPAKPVLRAAGGLTGGPQPTPQRQVKGQ